MAKRASGGKRRQVRSDAAEVRADGVVNRVSGHGTARDRRMYTQHELDFVNDLDAQTIWRSDDLLARAAEAKPYDAWRRGVHITANENSKELDTKMTGEIRRLEIVQRFRQAGAMENALGGSAILPIFDSTGGSLATPLGDTPRLRKMVAMHVLEPRELIPETWYGDIGNPRFRFPETYRFVPVNVIGGLTSSTFTQVIHESRLIIFDGIRTAPHHQLGQRIGWGDSMYFRVRQPAADYQMAWGSVSTILHDFGQSVYSLDQLHEMLKHKNGQQQVRNKLEFLDELRSTIRAMVIDGKDKWERKSTPVSGLAELLVQGAQRVAAAFEMPVTRLLGMSPAGLNATGESDIRIWYDTVELYRMLIDPKVCKALRLVFLQTDGPFKGVEPESWSLDWPELWQPSESEVADTRLKVAQADKLYVVDMGAFTASQIARMRAGGDRYSMDYNIDDSDLAAMERMEKQAMLHPQPIQAAAAPGTARAPSPNGPGAAGPDLTKMSPEQLADHAAGLIAAKKQPQPRADSAASDAISRELESDYPARAMEWIRSIKWVGPVRVPADDVDYAGEAGWKASGEPEKVSKFADRIEQGSEKPVLLVRRPGEAKLMIVDGHHRALAYRKLGTGLLAYVGNAPTLEGPWASFHDEQRAKADKATVRANGVNGHSDPGHGWSMGWKNAPQYKPGDEG